MRGKAWHGKKQALRQTSDWLLGSLVDGLVRSVNTRMACRVLEGHHTPNGLLRFTKHKKTKQTSRVFDHRATTRPAYTSIPPGDVAAHEM